MNQESSLPFYIWKLWEVRKFTFSHPHRLASWNESWDKDPGPLMSIQPKALPTTLQGLFPIILLIAFKEFLSWDQAVYSLSCRQVPISFIFLTSFAFSCCSEALCRSEGFWSQEGQQGIPRGKSTTREMKSSEHFTIVSKRVVLWVQPEALEGYVCMGLNWRLNHYILEFCLQLLLQINGSHGSHFLLNSLAQKNNERALLSLAPKHNPFPSPL